MKIDSNQRELGAPGYIPGTRVGIVVSSYHRQITGKLLDGARETLIGVGLSEKDIEVVWVPGSWEIPVVAQRMLERKKLHGVICLGCVIRGETTHDQHINASISQAIGRLAIEFASPVAFGVLTCNTLEQAVARSGGDVGNKGVEAAEAVLHVLNAFEQLED